MKTAKKSFAYLVLILGALIMVLPFFWMIISSLKTAAEVNTTPPTFWPKELVFENYVYAFEKAPFLRYFCNSLLVTIVCVACTMFTTILAAFAFSRLKFPGRDLLFSLLLSLMMIPFEMLIITNYTTIVKLGLNDTLIALILPFTSSIFYTYILRNFFLAIPDSLYYSARVDGASNWRYLWRVMVPMSRPALVTIGLLDAIAVDVVEMVVDSVEKTLASMDGDTNERALGAAATFFKTVNEALCNNLVLNRQLIENIPLDDFMAPLRAPLEHEIAERDLLPQGLKDEMFDYYLAFLLSGIIGIYRTWALSDGSVPIERVSEVANDLTLNGLSSLESRFE